MLEIKGEINLIMRCAVDTGAEINLVAESWLSTLNLLGYATVHGPPVEIEWVADAKDLLPRLRGLIDAGDVVLVKGSKGIKVSLLVDGLRKLGHSVPAQGTAQMFGGE